MQQHIEKSHEAVISTPPKKSWRTWWRLLRPHTLTAAFVPVSIGTVLALKDGEFHLLLFAAMMFASILIQAATNMFNEYYDFKRGLDNEKSVGIGGAIVREGVSPKTVLNLAFTFFGIATLLGIYICINSSWWVAAIGTICMIAGYLYTGGPHPIAYTPFGEIVAGLFMGLTIILLSYFIQTGTVTTASILVSVPISILVGAILLANNIRDLDGDKENGRKTLAILLGHNKAVLFLTGMFVVSYLWMVSLVVAGMFSAWSLIVFISVPKAIQAAKGFKGKTLPVQMMPAMQATAQTNTHFGFLLALGLLISYIL
ncbi:1,4-dihydroxy-2-naphthoate polyprenyltransferase [Bacillus tianshenii]|nr:1,4-dihydroxy-2-naphthoate polyprenyltransferase [Bacillus tianshenii]